MLDTTVLRRSFVQPLGFLQGLTARVAPLLHPLVVYTRALAADTRGDEGTSSSILRTMMVVIGTMIVIGGLIWGAVRALGVKVAGDIGAAGNWSP